jgi:hypothetical protein
VNTSSLPTCATYPAHIIIIIIIFDLITQTIVGEEYSYEVHHYAIFSMISLPPF